jgi:hypothetical protein
MRIYNSATHKKEEFQPIESGKVRMYVCGPTVYDNIHIGNARTFISFDVIRRWLIASGYEVTFAQNLTDVDDKIIKRANEQGRTAAEVATEFSDKFIGVMRAANVLERFQIAVIGEDPIARSVASRMWNIATATTDNSGMMLCDSEVPTDVDLVLEIASDELPADAAPRATIALAECHNLAQRIRTANVAAQQKPARIRIELTGMTRYNGTFTASDAQTLAVRLLDGVCDALAD